MALDLDPVYHTTTMVKILREQGCSQHAMELSEIVLAEKGGNEVVERILGELKEEAKRAFERFKNSGRVGEREAATDEPESLESSPLLEEPSGTAPVAEKEDESPSEAEYPEETRETHLSLVPGVEAPVSRLARLKELLARVERNRLRP